MYPSANSQLWLAEFPGRGGGSSQSLRTCEPPTSRAGWELLSGITSDADSSAQCPHGDSVDCPMAVGLCGVLWDIESEGT